MALPGTAIRRLTCQSYRQSLLKTFITSIGGPRYSGATPLLSPRRTFATSTQWHSDQISPSRIVGEDFPLNDISDEINASSKPHTSNPPSDSNHSPEPHVPWYLQVQPPVSPDPNPFSVRQALPDLPDHPPPLLEPLLTHVSVDLGMDDLSLLDLRALDPPSALGANLLMIVGTARSEKHLHVSADRLCRWLRTTYGLRPYADGLLGRNELKLKLRRRAKRSRLLSAVGAKATADTELEEGIRTGWVCVNVGRVEGGEVPEPEVQHQEEQGGAEVSGEGAVIGFGTRTGGSSVVVQLMMEEKREEIDLEKLWNAVMKMSVRERGAAELEAEKGDETGRGKE